MTLRKMPDSWKLAQQTRFRRREKALEKAAEEDGTWGPPEKVDPEILKDPVEFCRVYLEIHPDPVPGETTHRRIEAHLRVLVETVRASQRLSAARMIQRCLQFPGTLRLIVAPGLRQSMIMMDKIQDFIYNIPKSHKTGPNRKGSAHDHPLQERLKDCGASK